MQLFIALNLPSTFAKRVLAGAGALSPAGAMAQSAPGGSISFRVTDFGITRDNYYWLNQPTSVCLNIQRGECLFSTSQGA
jgi:hypothetical protein